MERSFKGYVQNHLYNEIFSYVSDYIEMHPDTVEKKCHKLHQVGVYSLSDIEIPRVDVSGMEGLSLDIIITVIANVVVQEGDYYYDDEEEIRLWYTINATGDLSHNLKDFKCVNINDYLGKIQVKNALTDYFVPVMDISNLDDIATDFLQKYYPEALQSPTFVDPNMLVTRMGLRKEVLNITEDCSVFGRIYFCDSQAAYYDDDLKEMKTKSVSAGTILVDPNVFFFRNLGAVNNTIIHECTHWAFHRPAFELERLFDSALTNIECRVLDGSQSDNKWTKEDAIEWQSNSLTPRIQMPEKMFKQKAHELMQQYIKETNASMLMEVMPTVIDGLAQFFVVSRLSAKIRLSNVGYEEANGTFIWLDNHYVAPHMWKEGFLNKNQTFSIGEDDLVEQCIKSYKLRDTKEAKRFIYVDSHLVLNSPDYVRRNLDGDLELTEYARSHMDECCIVFDMIVQKKEDKSYISECYLNRDKDSDVAFEFVYHNGVENASDERKLARMEELLDEETATIENLPRTYPQIMKYLLERSKMTTGEIAEEINMNEKTVRRVMSGEHGNAKTLAAVLLSMQISPAIGDMVWEAARWKLDPMSKEDRYLKVALQHLSGRSMPYIREFLHKRGVNF